MTNETPEATYDYTEAKRRSEWIQGMRDMADFFDKNPQLRPPYTMTVNVMAEGKDELAAFARVAGWKKEYTDSWFILRRQFGENITLDVNVYREEVCRKVEVGEKVIPAVEAQPERTEKVYEWVCDDAALLAANADPRRI